MTTTNHDPLPASIPLPAPGPRPSSSALGPTAEGSGAQASMQGPAAKAPPGQWGSSVFPQPLRTPPAEGGHLSASIPCSNTPTRSIHPRGKLQYLPPWALPAPGRHCPGTGPQAAAEAQQPGGLGGQPPLPESEQGPAGAHMVRLLGSCCLVAGGWSIFQVQCWQKCPFSPDRKEEGSKGARPQRAYPTCPRAPTPWGAGR